MLVQKINEAIAEADTEFLIAHLDDDIKWNIVGMPVIKGKENFLEAVKMMEIQDFKKVTVENIIADGNYVVVESTGIQAKGNSGLFYCDIYEVKNEKINELRTYIIDTESCI